MKLLIDTTNGIAGDIVCAGLIGLGAEMSTVTGTMEHAGQKLGTATVLPEFKDPIVSLRIELEEDDAHLHEDKARELLNEILSELQIEEQYAQKGKRILEVLCEAERHVHTTNPELKQHSHDGKAVLHESKDILMDIAGFCAGIQELDITEVLYLDHVCVGSGQITFSHGTFDVPAPATEEILNKFEIPWKHSEEIEAEMATPTGVSILAGSGAVRVEEIVGLDVLRSALARGTEPLPPVMFSLVI